MKDLKMERRVTAKDITVELAKFLAKLPTDLGSTNTPRHSLYAAMLHVTSIIRESFSDPRVVALVEKNVGAYITIVDETKFRSCGSAGPQSAPPKGSVPGDSEKA